MAYTFKLPRKPPAPIATVRYTDADGNPVVLVPGPISEKQKRRLREEWVANWKGPGVGAVKYLDVNGEELFKGG